MIKKIVFYYKVITTWHTIIKAQHSFSISSRCR